MTGLGGESKAEAPFSHAGSAFSRPAAYFILICFSTRMMQVGCARRVDGHRFRR